MQEKTIKRQTMATIGWVATCQSPCVQARATLRSYTGSVCDDSTAKAPYVEIVAV